MSDVSKRPNILIILTDQQRFPTSYDPEELRQWRRDDSAAERSLGEIGVSFTRHYAMATACAPSRASLLTGQYPSLHGVTQTDGLGKSFDGPDMFWLSGRCAAIATIAPHVPDRRRPAPPQCDA
jgi:arylsulfatase A-like enzyme